MAIFNIEDYIQLMIQNSEPHGSNWTDSENSIIVECIANGVSLSDIKRIISLRSLGAIRTRANSLGYGNRRNEDDGETYFSREINYKNRRTKDEILEGKEFVSVPIESKNSLRTDNEIDTVIIAKKSTKVEISVEDLDAIIDMLTLVRRQL